MLKVQTNQILWKVNTNSQRSQIKTTDHKLDATWFEQGGQVIENEIVNITFISCFIFFLFNIVFQTQAVGKALKEKNFELAAELRGK